MSARETAYTGSWKRSQRSPRFPTLHSSHRQFLRIPYTGRLALVGYNRRMSAYRFYYPIEIRYGDIDPQGHVNNAKYLTYLEQARVGYLLHLGLWDGKLFDDIGIILAEANLKFLSSIRLGQDVRVGVRVSRLGNKSMDMVNSVEDAQTHKRLAEAHTVLVAYEYRQRQAIPIPVVWRHAIASFEGIPHES